METVDIKKTLLLTTKNKWKLFDATPKINMDHDMTENKVKQEK